MIELNKAYATRNVVVRETRRGQFQQEVVWGPYFVAFSQGVLFRGADFPIVWPEIAAMAVIGSVYFAFALSRFRRVIFGD